MAKTYDEKRVAFQRMLGARLPKAVKSVELLCNLSRKSDYAYSPGEVRNLMDSLDEAVDMVAAAYGVQAIIPDDGSVADEVEHLPEVSPDAIPFDQRAEVRWAYEALRRGDKKLAENRMHRVIEAWIEEEKG